MLAHLLCGALLTAAAVPLPPPPPLRAAAPAPAASAPDDGDDVAEQEVEVATRTPLTARNAPNVVSVIERDEIEAAGVRDLLDLLLLVPGFAAGVDVEGVSDVGFRGLWGHEGKVLFLLDGLELNETLYSTMQLGGRVPIDLVERVEVIRGPGSVVYGGYAELAVVSIITRRPRDGGGFAGSAEYARADEGLGRGGAAVSWAGPVGGVPGLAASTSVGYSESVRSASGDYRDFLGATFPMRGSSGLSDLLLDVGLQYGGLKLRAAYDDYRVHARDGNGEVLATPDLNRFESTFLDARWDARASPTVTVTPRVSYKLQTPWQTVDRASPLYYDKTAGRLDAGLGATWRPSGDVELLAGAEGIYDHARLNGEPVGQQTTFGGARTVEYETGAAYGQATLRSAIADLVVGARWEHHSAVGSSFVPRAALTRILGRWNLKLLYSQAFRAPGIENININPGIRPERTHIVEAEAGVQLNGHVALVANGYFIRIDGPIVYDVDPATGTERYLNGDRTGSAGAEAQFRAKYRWGFANVSWSFSTPAGLNRIGIYAVPGRDDVLLGLPAHKGTFHGGLHLRRGLDLGGSLVWMSPRYGYASGDGAGNPVLGQEAALLLVGAALTWRDVATQGVDVSVGVQNLLDQSHRVLQPFDGGHAALPMAGREVSLRLTLRQPVRGE
ncbi:MAG: TonB-dependent receptor plug domain-containing protein [Anaeromyxobacteraceae bacterium]